MQTLFAYLQVALGLGFVIFVHELGHFLVAKACGVRCDKFMVGFDIGGLKLSRKWGETVYGIGILPLGGYVKMYGQDDNVQNIAEEMEKSQALAGSPDAKEVTGPGGEKMWIHKRSYMAKSVPQRMAIISAGVIMNVIFAVVMAWVAFGLGVPEVPASVGSTIAGSPAWKAGLRTGDQLVRINDIENPTYKQLRESVILGDLSKGLACVVRRADGETENLTLRPEMMGPAPQVGVLSMNRLRLVAGEAVDPHSPAASLGDDGFQPGDQVVEVDGQPLESYDELAAVLITRRDEPLDLTVVRGGKAPSDNPFGVVEGGERVNVTLPPDPMERLGIVPTLGAVVAIESGSPAEEAGLEVGDQIVAVDGVAIGSASEGAPSLDPVLIDQRLASVAERGESAMVSVVRGDEAIELSVTPRVVTWRTLAATSDAPLPLDSLGAACDLTSVVAALVGGSPAAAVDLRPGDRIVSATFHSTDPAEKIKGEATVPFGPGKNNWPALLFAIQDRSPALEVVLTVERPATSGPSESEKEAPTHTVTLKPQSDEGLYSDGDRGLRFAALKELHTAKTFGEQTKLAFEETGNALMSVVRFLQKIGSQVSVKALGGPLTIAQVAGEAAFEGVGSLLMSLVMLSANLAVLNFLPIPVLDGGHMMFLLYEGVTGRPASERVMIVLQSVGLLFLLGLMLFVFTLDFARLFGISL